MAAETPASTPARHRPRSATVFVAAFVAGAAAAVGVNRALDVHLSQAKPQVECEPIFVALRSLPQGVPVTVWDVALRDWPKAMLPSTALRVTDSFEGCLLRVPLREGQPLLSAQLVKPEAKAPAASDPPTTDGNGEEPVVEEAFVAPPPAAAPVASAAATDTHAEATVTPVESGPASEPATVAAADATLPPEVAGEPTLAAPAVVTPAQQSEPAVAAAAPTPSEDDGQSAGSIDAAFDVGDMPSRPPADLTTIPSVMSQAGGEIAAPSADESGSGASVRYLVVPERIARQADTSFTAPVAPESQPAGAREQATQQPRSTGQMQAQQVQPAPQPQQIQPGQQAKRTQSSQQAQSRQRQATSRMPQTKQPKAATPRGQSQQKPDSASREEPSPRAWGGMFPNVSAGLEAMGGWRGRVREAAVPQTEPARP